MASNPLIPQGTLNRVRGSFICIGSPELNVTAAFLGKGGLSMGFEGEGVNFIGTMSGVVTSPQPYLMASVTLNLLKTQGLASVYEQRRQKTSLIGDCKVKGDASTLDDYYVYNMAIESVRELSFAGEDAGYVVMARGYILINNDLWNLI